jgi:predicted alpha/beta superfamily hydrolase
METPLPAVSSQVVRFSDNTGVLTRYANFPSRLVAPRHVDVWLPASYSDHPARRYPVLYMHDGQNVFDPASAFAGVDWGVDEALGRLGIEALVVGIWSTAARRREYMPQQPLEAPAADLLRQQFIAVHGGAPESDRYLVFLVTELKPFVDGTFRTIPDARHTAIMGSSMGGLVSLYALCRYPHVFGGAGCVSTHWVIGGNLLVDALGALLPPAGQHRIYFDYGTETLDAGYEPFQQRMDERMQAAGYRLGQDWVTRKFAGADHSERAWRQRVDVPLAFLLR